MKSVGYANQAAVTTRPTLCIRKNTHVVTLLSHPPQSVFDYPFTINHYVFY